MNKIFTVLICVFAIGIGYSQGPAFKYQGVARNAQNASLNNQAIALRLTILNAGNSPVYSEVHSVTTSAIGLFPIKS